MSGNDLYARGRRAWGQCGKCGLRALLRTLVPDGYFEGLMVHVSCRDGKHPQEEPIEVTDATALERPAPRLDPSVEIPISDPRWGEKESDFVGGDPVIEEEP